MTDTATGTHHPSERPTSLRGAPRRLTIIVMFAALIVLAGVVLCRLIATALGGFKELGELQSHPFSLPHEWVWKNYLEHPDRLSILAGARQFARS